MSVSKGSCVRQRTTSYREPTNREKEGTQEHKKPGIIKISFLVEGNKRHWISSILSMLMAFWTDAMSNPASEEMI